MVGAALSFVLVIVVVGDNDAPTYQWKESPSYDSCKDELIRVLKDAYVEDVACVPDYLLKEYM